MNLLLRMLRLSEQLTEAPRPVAAGVGADIFITAAWTHKHHGASIIHLLSSRS